jgi:predicted nucleotide-binding protein (sugar kinase/HSP70/actin superfamily)
MSDKIMLNFRCPSEVLEAIDNLGKERYPANTKHGCDRSKTLMDIMRAGIEALSDGSVILPAPVVEARQQSSEVRQELSDSLLEERITEIIERKTEQAKAELKAELLGELVA